MYNFDITTHDSKKISKKPPKDQCAHRISVLIAGFPLQTTITEVKDFLKKIAPKQKSTPIKGPKNTFRGFLFIHFKTMKVAEKFTAKNHYFGDRQLDCKISINHNDFTNESVQNIKEPRKIIAEKLPQTLQKQDIADIFNKYGKIEEIIIVNVLDEEFCNVFITFENYIDSKTCANDKQVYLLTGEVINVRYAKPKFSNYMLKKIDPELRFYIIQLKKEIIAFKPQDFISLENQINQCDNSEKSLEDFYKRFEINYLDIKNEFQKEFNLKEKSAKKRYDTTEDQRENSKSQNSYICDSVENFKDDCKYVIADPNDKLSYQDKNKQKKYDQLPESSNIQSQDDAKSNAKNFQRENNTKVAQISNPKNQILSQKNLNNYAQNLKKVKGIKEDLEPENRKWSNKFISSDYDVNCNISKITYNNTNGTKFIKDYNKKSDVTCSDFVKKNLYEPLNYKGKNYNQNGLKDQQKYNKNSCLKILDHHLENHKPCKDFYEQNKIYQKANNRYKGQNIDYVDKTESYSKANYDIQEQKYGYNNNGYQNNQLNFGENDSAQRVLCGQNDNYDFDYYQDFNQEDNRNYYCYDTGQAFLQNDEGQSKLHVENYYPDPYNYEDINLNSYPQNEYEKYYKSSTYFKEKHVNPSADKFADEYQSYGYYYDQYGYDDTSKYELETYCHSITHKQQLSDYEVNGGYNNQVCENFADNYSYPQNNSNTDYCYIENQGKHENQDFCDYGLESKRLQ